MPTTASGTPYTVRLAGITGYGFVYWGVADAHYGDANVKTILYAHGAGGAADQFATLAAWQGLRDWLIDNGWAWVEGTGGTNLQSWGNQAAREAYPAYLAYVKTQMSVGPVILLGRSMGGLVTAWMYAMSADAGTYAGWINNSGVSTLFTGDTTTSGDPVNRATGQYFGSTLWNAWGAGNYADFATAAAAYAPESWPATVWAGKKIINLYGDADTTVPFFPRGAKQLQTQWVGQPTIDDSYARPGGTHSTSNGSYSDVTQMVAFLQTVTGGAPPPTPDGFVAVKVLKRYLVTPDGQSHLIKPRLV